MSRTTFWAESWWTGTDVWEGTAVTVGDGGTILAIEAAPAPPSGATVLGGVVMPGFVNAHSHAFHRVLRGLPASGDFWTWRQPMLEAAERLDPENYERLATAVYAEMALAGYTWVGEFHYVHHQSGGVPYTDPNEMSHALVRAARAAGIRITLLDTLYLTGGVDGRPLEGPALRFSDRDPGRFAERHAALAAGYEGATDVTVGVAVHSVRAVPPEAMARLEPDGPVHAHVSEQPAENEASRAAFGRSPLEVFADAGLVDGRFTAVHAVHVGASEIDLLSRTGAGVCVCPTTERELGDGIAPAAELSQAGVRLAVGSDSHAVVDPFAEMQAVEMDDRLRLLRRGVHAPERLLAAATSGGAVSVGGTAEVLAVGAPGDFVAVDTGSVRLAGVPLPEGAVTAATASDVVDVVVAGRHVVSDGRHCLVPDVPARLTRTVAEVRS